MAIYFCYVDESGGFEAPDSSPQATPLMVVAGLVVSAEAVSVMTQDFINLKRRFFPRVDERRLDYQLVEVKGSSLRAQVRSASRREVRHAIGMLDGVVKLLEEHDARLVGRVWIKEQSERLHSRSTYTFAIQDIARHFDHFLRLHGAQGLVVCDGRRHYQDVQVSHSIFTQKYKASGDSLPQLAESVVFGRSDNHTGLQVADIVASALIFPMAARTYCSDVGGVHVDEGYDRLRSRYATRVGSLQHRYQDAEGRGRGGVVVSDKRSRRPSSLLFRPPGLDDTERAASS